jgi:hypothetical protein
MDKNIIYMFACERKRIKAFTWNDKHKETFIQLCNKRITHVQPKSFLKEKHYLDACYRCLVVNTPFHCILLINPMNKRYVGH